MTTAAQGPSGARPGSVETAPPAKLSARIVYMPTPGYEPCSGRWFPDGKGGYRPQFMYSRKERADADLDQHQLL